MIDLKGRMSQHIASNGDVVPDSDVYLDPDLSESTNRCSPIRYSMFLPIERFVNWSVFYESAGTQVTRVLLDQATMITAMQGTYSVLLNDLYTKVNTMVTGSENEKVLWFDPMIGATETSFANTLTRYSIEYPYMSEYYKDVYIPDAPAFSITSFPASSSSGLPRIRSLGVTKHTGVGGSGDFADEGVGSILYTSLDPGVALTSSNVGAAGPAATANNGYGWMIKIIEESDGKIYICGRNEQLIIGQEVEYQARKAFLTLNHAEKIDQHGDYVNIFSMQQVERLLGHDATLTLKPVLRPSVTTDGEVDAYPYVSLLGGRCSGTTDDLKIEDITVSSHRSGQTTVAYSYASRTSAQPCVVTTRTADDVLLCFNGPTTPSADKSLTMGVLGITGSAWNKGTLMVPLATDVVFRTSTTFDPLSINIDESSVPYSYAVGAGTDTDTGLVPTSDVMEGMLVCGHLVKSGRINNFGDARWHAKN